MNGKLRKIISLSLILSFLLFMGLPFISASAEEVRVVEGLIENVTGDSIEIRGNYYEFTGVPLKNASDEILSKDELKTGRKVAIFLRDSSITTILIYDENMLE